MRRDIPVTPDADEARRWASEELANAEYNRAESGWVDAVIRWFMELLNGFDSLGNGTPPLRVIVVILIVLAIVALVIWLVAGPLRASRKAERENAVFEDDQRTSAQMRAAAQQAAAHGDFDTAVLEMYRALVRDLEERAILDDRPGTTAFEAAQDIAALFAFAADAVAADAAVFDTVRYGDGHAEAADYDHVQATAASLSGASLTVGDVA
jgi:hypothetical protein